jgi:hypothetical protein
MAYASFPGDNRTFAAVLAAPPGVEEWTGFREAGAYETAVRAIPALASWADPKGVDPITEVLPMAGLRNSIRCIDEASLVGLVHVGDALCHTDPTLAHGLAFALIHAAALSRALSEQTDVADAAAAYYAEVMPAARERYEFITAYDEQRHRMWRGEPVDFTSPNGDYALFSMMAAGATASRDPDIFRAFVRRIGLLDSTTVLDCDSELQGRIEQQFREMLASPRPPAGPSGDEMRRLVAVSVSPRA